MDELDFFDFIPSAEDVAAIPNAVSGGIDTSSLGTLLNYLGDGTSSQDISSLLSLIGGSDGINTSYTDNPTLGLSLSQTQVPSLQSLLGTTSDNQNLQDILYTPTTSASSGVDPITANNAFIRANTAQTMLPAETLNNPSAALEAYNQQDVNKIPSQASSYARDTSSPDYMKYYNSGSDTLAKGMTDFEKNPGLGVNQMADLDKSATAAMNSENRSGALQKLADWFKASSGQTNNQLTNAHQVAKLLQQAGYLPQQQKKTNLQNLTSSALMAAQVAAATQGSKKAPLPTQVYAKPMTWKKKAGGGTIQGGPGGLGALGLLRGGTGGQDDVVPIAGSHGEYMFDADTVSALGDGNTEAGAKKLDKMRERIRKHKRSAPITKIPPKAKDPMTYLGVEKQ